METNRFLVLLAAIWFQKPAFEWVWKHIRVTAAVPRKWFQKPAFEWVWKLFPDTDGLLLTGFQKPAFERVWKLYELAGFSLAYVVSEACI